MMLCLPGALRRPSWLGWGGDTCRGQGPQLLCAPEGSAPEARRTGRSGWPGSALARPLTRRLSAGPGLPRAQSPHLGDTDLLLCVHKMTSGLQRRALSPAHSSNHPLHPQGERKGPSFPGEQALGWAVNQGGISSRLTRSIVWVLRSPWPPPLQPTCQGPL